ncbi:MAG: TatD family hydrolase [Chloroflexota bacterium]
MNLTDTHCHLDLDKFDEDRNCVLNRARAAGVTRILIPGIDLSSSKRVVELAQLHPELFAAIGVHPSDSLSWDDGTADQLRVLFLSSADREKIVAIGEIGLDYYWNNAPHEWQQAVLKKQLCLAAELQLPVILHMREHADSQDGDCSSDLLAILQSWILDLQSRNNPLVNAPGVLHSFSGSLETAKSVIDLNFLIGITGPVTYKNAEAKREVVKSLPLECILTETDAPFLAPVPHRGHRNEPAFVSFITDKIAEIHNKNPEEIAALTSNNAARLFSWGG